MKVSYKKGDKNMAKIKLLIEMDSEYSRNFEHEDEWDWFYNDLLMGNHTENDDKLYLHSNYIGATIGEIKVLAVKDDTSWRKMVNGMTLRFKHSSIVLRRMIE